MCQFKDFQQCRGVVDDVELLFALYQGAEDGVVVPAAGYKVFIIGEEDIDIFKGLLELGGFLWQKGQDDLLEVRRGVGNGVEFQLVQFGQQF